MGKATPKSIEGVTDSHSDDALISKRERHKCPACFKQYKKKEHLVEHMKISYHSIHQPKCSICKKHCKSLESVREHLSGPLAKRSCLEIFKNQGCSLCLKIFGCPGDLATHKEECCLSPAAPLVELLKDIKDLSLVEKTIPECEPDGSEFEGSAVRDQQMSVIGSSESLNGFRPTLDKISGNNTEVVSMDCEMVGGGSDGSLDLCARVCLIDENEHLIFHSYVKQQIPVTDYRFEITGISGENLAEAPSLQLVRWKIEKILYNKESISTARLSGGRARILVGHGVEHDLECLGLNYPDHLIRDTSHYPPLMKTNLVSHQLKYLAKAYLGYDIQSNKHDPYEDSVAALRIYKRLRSQSHLTGTLRENSYNRDGYQTNALFFSEKVTLEEKSPEELLQMSCSKYRCWCLDKH